MDNTATMNTRPTVSPAQPSLVVIGNFDGVHRGHQKIVRTAIEEARAAGLVPTVLTFHPHPVEVLGKKTGWTALTTIEEKVRLLEALDPSLRVIVEPFTSELAQLTPREFVSQVLCEELQARRVLVGDNFRFGAGRAGTLETLVELGREFGFEARAEQLVTDETGPLSSTRVRSLLDAGQVKEAAHILGRFHAVAGVVVQGQKRGRLIGFPTANLEELRARPPAPGVYAVWVQMEQEDTGEEFLPLGEPPLPWGRAGVLHWGARPTVDQPPALEVHLLDFEGDLYGKSLRVQFVEQIRGVQKFDSLEALRVQIERDCTQAREILARAAEELAPGVS